MDNQPCPCGRGVFRAMSLMDDFSGDLNCTACNRYTPTNVNEDGSRYVYVPPPEPNDVLSKAELSVLNHLVSAYNEFADLPDHRADDATEFAQHIHVLQRHVMARLARRMHPDLFGT